MEDTNRYEYNTALGVYRTMLFEFDAGRPYSEKEINAYLRDPYNYNRQLRDLSWWAYRINGTISAAVNYIRSLHTLDYVVVSKAGKTKRPRNFAKNSKTFNQVLEMIRYKEIFRDMLLKCCNDGTYFYYLETTSPIDSVNKTLSTDEVWRTTEINSTELNATIIPLPIDYCRIVGRKNNSYIMAFNLEYFDHKIEPELSTMLRGMPAEIRTAYAGYRPGSSKSWVILDNNHTLVGKIKSGINQPWGEPLAIAALNDVLYAEYFVQSKRTVLNQLNHQIVYETFPEGATKGTSALTNKQQTEQHTTVRDAIYNSSNVTGTTFISLAGGTKLDQIGVDTSIFSDNTEGDVRDNVAVDVGVAPSVLNGKSNGNYATSTLNVEMLSSYVYSWIDEFSNELSKCVQNCVIADKSCPVAMYVLPTTFVNRDKMVRQMSDLYTKGKGSLTMWVAATGINPNAYFSLMDYELMEDFENKYPVHATSFNSGVSDNEAGRPVVDDSTNASTIGTKTNDGNSMPSPS